MGLFSSHTTLSESGLFTGFTDFHCHALPGVDDGIKTLEDCLGVLDEFEKAGMREVWFTPHIMEDIPNKTAVLRQKFEEVKARYRGVLNLRLASENMLDSLFEDRLAEGDLLPLEGRRLLVETSYFNPPMDLQGILERIRAKGYRPVLAHPERYMYMAENDYRDLRGREVLFQLNVPSLLGFYGPEVQQKAEWILGQGMYELSGTDLHRAGSFRHILEGRLKTKTIRQIPV